LLKYGRKKLPSNKCDQFIILYIIKKRTLLLLLNARILAVKVNDNDENALTSLIKLTIAGHFPVLNKSWTEVTCDDKLSSIPTKNKIITERIIQRIARFKSIEKKQAVLSRLSDDDKKIFIQTFLYMLENRVRIGTPSLQ